MLATEANGSGLSISPEARGKIVKLRIGCCVRPTMTSRLQQFSCALLWLFDAGGVSSQKVPAVVLKLPTMPLGGLTMWTLQLPPPPAS